MGIESRRVGRAGLLAKENLTTGEAARLLCVSPQVVVRCIDGGSLAAWKVPGSRARRIRTADLVAFARANRVPLPRPETAPTAGGTDPVADPPPGPDQSPRTGGLPDPDGTDQDPLPDHGRGESRPGPWDGRVG